MKAFPTLEGGLRLDAEHERDWDLLRKVVVDATRCDQDLASRLGEVGEDEFGSEDWRDYVLPDLREEFEGELQRVLAAIQTAEQQAAGGPGSLWIAKEEGFQWYGAFNQARLALEECYHFGDEEQLDISLLNPDALAAFSRSCVYAAIQQRIFNHVML